MLEVRFNYKDSNQNPSAYQVLVEAQEHAGKFYKVSTEYHDASDSNFLVCQFDCELTTAIRHIMNNDIAVEDWKVLVEEV